jgi:hypothetical protein
MRFRYTSFIFVTLALFSALLLAYLEYRFRQLSENLTAYIIGVLEGRSK